MNAGYLDICNTHHVAGWSTSCVRILINGVDLMKIVPWIERSDLATIPGAKGFTFEFEKKLLPEDEVLVVFENGEPIDGSTPDRSNWRFSWLTSHASANSRILEVGPLSRPVARRERFPLVKYLDHASQGELISKYDAKALQIATKAIDLPTFVAIDFVWDGCGSLANSTGHDKFDLVIASHVIEHVPDPIGWLAAFSEIVVPRGCISLAVPHRDFTFDHLRPVTTLAQILDAHERRLVRPSFAQIFDHISGVAAPGSDRPWSTVEQAYAVARSTVETNDYLDVHCHTWTPESWTSIWTAVVSLGLLPRLAMAEVRSPPTTTNEFMCSFCVSEPGSPPRG